jgi:putative heme-binding domain-containing protein
MPATSLSTRQLRQIVKHVQKLAGGVRVAVPGDPSAGEKLFAGKGACGQCHMIHGAGGRLGPDLTEIGSLRSPSYLRTSVLKPDDEISAAYSSVDAVDSDGASYSGIRLNEDTYTIQIMDLQENLRSFAKKDLRSLTVGRKKSRMPAYEAAFTQSELDDLVAYLYSLRRNERQR